MPDMTAPIPKKSRNQIGPRLAPSAQRESTRFARFVIIAESSTGGENTAGAIESGKTRSSLSPTRLNEAIGNESPTNASAIWIGPRTASAVRTGANILWTKERAATRYICRPKP